MNSDRICRVFYTEVNGPKQTIAGDGVAAWVGDKGEEEAFEMRRRLYFVLPDLESAETIEKELLLARIDDPHIHFLAKDGVNMGRLHLANLLQRSDLLHGIGTGLVAGGITGALAGVALSFFPRMGEMMGLGGILILAVVCAMIGSWISGMIAVSIPNSRLRRFQPAIDRGEILLMVDVPVRRVKEIRELIVSHHPEAKASGQEAQIPAFP
jgi:hypothetical protein